MMKSIVFSTIKMFTAFLVTLLTGSVTGAVLYMIYNMCSTLVAGQGFAAFNLAFFTQGLFLCLPFIFVVCPAFIAFYCIRNKRIGFIPVVVFSVIYIAIWIFVQPFIIRSGIQKASKSSYIIHREPLSKGYFRNVTDRYVFYYSSVDEEHVASGICIDKNASTENVYTFKDIELPNSAAIFTDSLIQTSIEIPQVTQICIRYIANYLGIVTLEVSTGFISWLIFSSMALLLCSLMFLKNFSRWRFVNVILILTLSLIVIYINVDILSFGRLYLVTERINSIFTFAPDQSNFLLFIINVVLSVVSILLGLLAYAKNNEEQRVVAGYGDDF